MVVKWCDVMQTIISRKELNNFNRDNEEMTYQNTVYCHVRCVGPYQAIHCDWPNSGWMSRYGLVFCKPWWRSRIDFCPWADRTKYIHTWPGVWWTAWNGQTNDDDGWDMVLLAWRTCRLQPILEQCLRKTEMTYKWLHIIPNMYIFSLWYCSYYPQFSWEHKTEFVISTCVYTT
jgi:hypothetical protein